MTDRRQLERLTLQIERDLSTRENLRTLLTAADAAVASGRQDARYLRARIRRATRPSTRAGQTK